jgi:hypothetical protein
LKDLANWRVISGHDAVDVQSIDLIAESLRECWWKLVQASGWSDLSQDAKATLHF